MRNWLFHPIIFYPLALILAVLVIAVSIRPQAWPRSAAPVAAEIADNTLTYDGAAFSTPGVAPEQNTTVMRDFWGNAETLRIAQKPNQPQPTPAEQGVRILMTPEDAARVSDKPVTVEIFYNALPMNGAWGLGVSLQGANPATWIVHPTPPDGRMVRFDLPAQNAVNAIGLRAVQEGQTEAFGLEITRIRVTPRA